MPSENAFGCIENTSMIIPAFLAFNLSLGTNRNSAISGA